MRIHKKAIREVHRLRHSLVTSRQNTLSEKTKIALSALIDEVDKLPGIIDELFAETEPRPRIGNDRSFPFATLQPGDFFDVDHTRLNSLRACASTFGTRHGVRMSVREKPNGGARCARVDGLDHTPECLLALKLGEDLTIHEAQAGLESLMAAGLVETPSAPESSTLATMDRAPTRDELRAIKAKDPSTWTHIEKWWVDEYGDADE